VRSTVPCAVERLPWNPNWRQEADRSSARWELPLSVNLNCSPRRPGMTGIGARPTAGDDVERPSPTATVALSADQPQPFAMGEITERLDHVGARAEAIAMQVDHVDGGRSWGSADPFDWPYQRRSASITRILRARRPRQITDHRLNMQAGRSRASPRRCQTPNRHRAFRRRQRLLRRRASRPSPRRR
jgi:hypothetical protein